MASTTTKSDGSFSIQGSSSDYESFKPTLVFEHMCKTAVSLTPFSYYKYRLIGVVPLFKEALY